MHYPTTDIQAEFEINRSARYSITAKKEVFQQTPGGQTDSVTDVPTLRMTTIGIFFEDRKNTKSGSAYSK